MNFPSGAEPRRRSLSSIRSLNIKFRRLTKGLVGWVVSEGDGEGSSPCAHTAGQLGLGVLSRGEALG